MTLFMKARLILPLLFISSMAIAQFKPHIGMNWAQLSSEPQDFTKEGRLGFVIGAGFKFGESWYVEPGVQFSNLGTKLINKDDNDITHQSYVQTIRVPVMAGYDLMDKESLLNLRLYTGPSASFVMGVNTENSAAPDGVLPEGKENYVNTIWGWNFGVGIDITFIYVELGYELGLTDFYSIKTPNTSGVKNNAFFITAGVNLF